MKTIVIVPAYNEEKSIENVVKEIQKLEICDVNCKRSRSKRCKFSKQFRNRWSCTNRIQICFRK